MLPIAATSIISCRLFLVLLLVQYALCKMRQQTVLTQTDHSLLFLYLLRGEIPVCNEVSMEMNRIDGLIANPNIYYDDKAGRRVY